MTVNTLLAAADSRVVSSKPTQNLGGESNLLVSASPTTRISFFFANQPFPLGVTVLSAKLRLYQKGAATGGTRTVSVQRNSAQNADGSTDWSESKVTYNSRPLGTSGISQVTQGNSSTDGRLWEFDVTWLMQQVSDGAPWYGFRITSDNATTLYFYSKEAANDFVPVLEVEWSDAPDAPTMLAPGAGRSISVARPTLRFDFSTDDEDGSLAGIQVQVNTSNSFTSPAIDSGQIAASAAEWTLPSDLTLGATYYWRARVQSSSGLWSAWSAVDSFKRTAKPTVAITNPSGGSTLYDPTPTFSWTVTGGTQVARQLFLVDPANPSDILWTSGKETASSTSYTLPQSQQLLMTPGSSYRLVLKVWDSVAREAIPEEPANTRVTSDFTLGTSGSSAITAFTVSSTGTPFALLQWTYSGAAPDAFVVIEGGKIIAQVDPADAFVSGTTYQYEDRRVKPGQTRTWGVAEKISGTTKIPVTETGKVEPEGVWLYELFKGGAAVQIGGAPDPTDMLRAEVVESTAVFEPPGAKNAVTITQARLGRRWSGVRGTVTSAQADAWDTIASKRAITLGLTATDMAIKVRIFNTYRDQREEFGDEFMVGFDAIECR